MYAVFPAAPANSRGGFQDTDANRAPFAYPQYVSPAQTIVIVESTARYTDFIVNNTFWAHSPSGDGDAQGCLFSGHTSFSNYLFCDGHVKSYKPLATLDKDDGGSNDTNLWRYDNVTFKSLNSGDTGAATVLNFAANKYQ